MPAGRTCHSPGVAGKPPARKRVVAHAKKNLQDGMPKKSALLYKRREVLRLREGVRVSPCLTQRRRAASSGGSGSNTPGRLRCETRPFAARLLRAIPAILRAARLRYLP